MTPFRPSRSAAAGFLILSALAGLGPQAVAAPSPLRVAEAAAPDADAHPSGSSDTMQSRSAARSRMRECGHQFSSMKKNGSAAGMTWKDFSQTCLTKQ